MAIIQGTSSAEFVYGSNDSDTITGRAGSDTFVFDNTRPQTDVITDFGSVYFVGAIQGTQEVPSNGSAASGSWTGALNRNQTQFNFDASISGLDLGGQTAATVDNVTAAHFHRAATGVSGGVVYGFIGTPFNDLDGDLAVNAAAGTVSGQWDANEGNGTNTLTSLVPALLNNEIYINFHTSVFPAGEIRGQALRVDQGLDLIDLTGTGIADFATLQQFMTEVGGSAQISMSWNGQASTLVLSGVAMSRLSASDFVFSTAGRGVAGSNGADDLLGAGGADWLIGEAGNDRIWGGGGADILEGRAGSDDVRADAGADQARGGDDNDTVRGMQDNDTVYGEGGADAHVNGNTGNDVVYGGDGNDTVYGGRDNDTVHGEDGNDWLSGDLGNDVLTGGAGADRFLFRAGSGADVVTDFSFAQGDRVQLAAGTAYTQAGGVITLAGGDTLTLQGSAGFTADWVVFV